MTKAQARARCGADTRRCAHCGIHRKEHDKTTGKSADARCPGFAAAACDNAPKQGMTRCRMHGGGSLVGPAHPNWQTGKHSRHLKGELGKVYTEGVNNPDLVSVRDDIALLDTRVFQLLEQIGETGNTKLLKEIRAKFDVFKAAGKKRGKMAAVEGLGALEIVDRLIDEAMTHAATWDELRETLDLRRRMSETETKRMRDLNQLIDVRIVVQVIRAFIEEVKNRVKDPEVLAALSAQFARTVGRGSSSDAPPGT